jgi:hypothetical protein
MSDDSDLVRAILVCAHTVLVRLEHTHTPHQLYGKMPSPVTRRNEGASYLLNGNALCLLFGSRFWKRHRQDTILDLGFHVLSLRVE